MNLFSWKYFTLLLLSSVIGNFSFGQSIGGVTSGTASYCAGDNSGFLSLTGQQGNILYWESSEDLVNWTNIGNPTSTQSYLDLLVTTHYRVIVEEPGFPADTSTISTITIYVPAEGGTIAGAGTFCTQSGAGVLTLNGSIGNVLNWMESTDGGNSWTNITNTTTTYNHPNITQETWYAAVLENEPGCPIDTSSIAMFFIDDASDAGSLTGSDTVCLGEHFGTINHNFGNGALVDWIASTDSGATWFTIVGGTTDYTYQNLNTTTQYQVVTQNGVCPADTTNTVTITVATPIQVDAGPDFDIVNHESVVLQGTGNGNITWSPNIDLDDPNSFTPTASPNQDITYFATLTDPNGCVTSDSMFIAVDVPIPSAFTPNEDGTNDFFAIDKVELLPNNSLTIYNRQGNVVFEKAPYNNEWNGRSNGGEVLPDGIYYFVFDLGEGGDPETGYVLIKR